MAVQIVLAVRDEALQAFSRPFFVPTVGIALRSFMDEVNRLVPENPMAQHPKDFSLFKLGEWDEDSGQFVNLPVPERLGSAIDFVSKEA